MKARDNKKRYCQTRYNQKGRICHIVGNRQRLRQPARDQPFFSAFCFLQSYLASDTHRKPQVVVDSHTLFPAHNLVSVPSFIAACSKIRRRFAAFQTKPEYQPPRDVDLSDLSKMNLRGLSCCHCAQSTHVAFSEKCCISGIAKVFGFLYIKCGD